MTKPMSWATTILDALADPAIFGLLYRGATWQSWRAFLAAVFGLTTTEQAPLIRRCTGRHALPVSPAREVFCPVGRRGGKSRIAALLAVYLACFKTYDTLLAPGERGVVMLIASDRRQARVLKRYVSGLFQAVPMLAQMVVTETAESIELLNHIAIEIHTASFRSIRGYTCVEAILDEIAFWPTDDAANPDSEILNALRPAMATVPGALLVAISSPYARRGELWKAYQQHYGKDHDPVLVWQADTKTMNPTVPDDVIAAAYADDEAAASAQYGAQFRRDIEVFIAREVVEACVVRGQYELPSVSGMSYVAFVDPSGGSQDSYTLALAHHEEGRTVLDCLREVRPPFSPEQTTAEFADLLTTYRVDRVMEDRYGGEWPREQFRKHGINYMTCEQTKSDLYHEVLPLLNSQRVVLLDNSRLLAQLCSLERRTARGGRDSIDHGAHGHDDVVNAAAGALVVAAQRAHRVPLRLFTSNDSSGSARQAQHEHILARIQREGCWWPGD